MESLSDHLYQVFKANWRRCIPFSLIASLLAAVATALLAPTAFVAQAAIAPNRPKASFSGSEALSALMNPNLSEPVALLSSRSTIRLLADYFKIKDKDVPGRFTTGMNAQAGVLQVEVSSSKPHQALDALSIVIDHVKERAAENKRVQLSDKLGSAKKRLALKESEHAQLHVLSLGKEMPGSRSAMSVSAARLDLQKIASLRERLATLETQLRLEQHQSAPAIQENPSPKRDIVERDLIALKATLQKKLASFDDGHPEIVLLRRQISGLENLLQDLVKQEQFMRESGLSSAVTSLEKERAGIQSQLAELEGRLAKQVPQSMDLIMTQARADAIQLEIVELRKYIGTFESEMESPDLEWYVLDPPALLEEPRRLSPVAVSIGTMFLALVGCVFWCARGRDAAVYANARQ